MNNVYEIHQDDHQQPATPPAGLMHLQPVMKTKDWIMTGILIVVAAGLWSWVWSEYQKPIITEEIREELSNRQTP